MGIMTARPRNPQLPTKPQLAQKSWQGAHRCPRSGNLAGVFWLFVAPRPRQANQSACGPLPCVIPRVQPSFEQLHWISSALLERFLLNGSGLESGHPAADSPGEIFYAKTHEQGGPFRLP